MPYLKSCFAHLFVVHAAIRLTAPSSPYIAIQARTRPLRSTLVADMTSKVASCLALCLLAGGADFVDSFGFGMGTLRTLSTSMDLTTRGSWLRTDRVGVAGGAGGMRMQLSAFKKGGKGKKKGGGGGKGGRGSSATKAAPKKPPPKGGNTGVDTSRKDYVYQVYRLNKTFGKGDGRRSVLKGVNLAFYPGAKIGVLGSNGSGKSTLMKIMAGVDTEFDGESRLSDWAKVGYLEQEPRLDDGDTVRENIEAAVLETRALLASYEEISKKMVEEGADMDKLSAELDRLQNSIEAVDGWELDRVVDRAMDALRCPDGNALVENLSGGEHRRVALCKLLLRRPDLLLLDEPTNHLDAESVAWLEDFLKDFPGTVVAITHDRYFLDNVAGWILELDRGEGFPFKGNYSGWMEKKAERLAAEKSVDSKRKKALERELEWVRMAPKARQAKNKARLARYESLSLEDENAAAAARATMDTIHIPPGPKLGDIVVQAKDLGKGVGDRLLYDNVNFDLPRGGVVGIIGANGVGKSTLLNMIAGLDTPNMGELVVGSTVQVMYVDQKREGLDDPDLSVFDAVTDGAEEIVLGSRSVNSRAYLTWFNFRSGDQQKKVNLLSGGERNRLNLARTLKQGGNLLLLDEPTNDLDVDTLRNLEEAINDYPGCAVIVSHDRYFLDRVATHTLAFEDDGQVVWFEGSFAEYEEDLRRRTGGDGPKRPKFRPLPAL
ncbi:unnamed protein product [Discosporangium mesarthrocarpum]